MEIIDQFFDENLSKITWENPIISNGDKYN